MTRNRIEVKGTTYEAFSSLANFIYDVPEYLPPTTDVKKLIDILNIAGRYQVKRLEEEVRMAMTTFPIKIEPISHEIDIEDPLDCPDGPIKKEQSFDNFVPL